MLAAVDIVSHMIDHPWPHFQVRVGGMTITLMSSGIATMVLVAVVLALLVPLAVKRRGEEPRGGYNLLEAMVVFVRDVIAAPYLGDRTYRFLPLLVTMFIFVLALNLAGLVPLHVISEALHTPYVVGGPTTSIPAVTGALASLSLLLILIHGMYAAAHRQHVAHGWPMGLCAAISPLLWMYSITPKVPGFAGKVLFLPLMTLEVVGAIARCFALMVRLFANMLAGHTMVAIMIMLALQAVQGSLESSLFMLPLGILPILGGVAVDAMHVLVAALQAYIFTFLTAMYLGLYTSGGH